MPTDTNIQRKDMLMVPVEAITVDEKNNYTNGQRGDIASLAESIKAEGVRTPLRCWKDSKGAFILLSGFRRMAAVRMINRNGKKIERVPVLLEDRYANDGDRHLHQLLENAHREDSEPVEKAKEYKKLLDYGLKIEEIAKRLGETPATVQRYLALLKAAAPVKKALEQGEIGLTAAAKIIAGADDEADQKKALEKTLQASKNQGKKKANIKHATEATRRRAPRQRTKSVDEVKAAIDDVEKFMKENTLTDELKARYQMSLDWLNWMIGGEKPL